ncbi:MAG TPA: hypothetical protein VGI88_15830, partial [Verrucomicrobiae bacterium]
IAELKAKGEPMDLAQVLPPPPSSEENGADTFRNAAAMIKDDQSLLSSNDYDAMKMVAPGKAAVCSQQSEAWSYNATNSWKEVETAVARDTNYFALLRQIIEKPIFDFRIHYKAGMDHLDFTNLYLMEVKHAALRLQTAAVSDLHRGDDTSAVSDLRTTLAIAKAMPGEHLLISELVRIAIASIAVSGTWEILQSTNVTYEQLAALQKDWASLEFFHSMEASMEMERAISLITITKWRSIYSEFGSQLVNAPAWFSRPKISTLDPIRIRSHIFQWRYWWSYPDELCTLKGDELILNACRVAQTNDAWLSIQNELQSNIAKLSIPTNENTYFWSSDPVTVDLHFALSDSVSSLAKAFSRAMRMEVARNAVITAIALKRYQLKHGDYPPSLSVLTLEFLPTVPRDIDGQPLRYRRNPDASFTLYSIGDDGKDDGGNPTSANPQHKSLYWQSERDWVWPQPATAEEIQKFYDNPSK